MENNILRREKLNKNMPVRAGQPYLYRKNGIASEVFEIRWKEMIRDEAMQKATEAAIARYPYFKVRFVEEKGEFYAVPNERAFLARKTQEMIPLGGEENNDYLLAVTYFDCCIRVAFHHGLADGRGIKFFVETLMYYYGFYAYGNREVPKGVRVLEDEISEKEWLDPCSEKKAFQKENVKKVEGLSRKGFTLPETEEKGPRNHRRYEFRISQEDFMRVCKEEHATPIILLSACMSRSIAGLYPDHKEPMQSNFPVDVREAVGAEGTFHNCVKSVSLPYGTKEEDMTLEELCNYYRSLLKQQRQKDYCIKDFNMIPMLLKGVNIFPSLKAKQKLLHFLENVKLDTYMMSYVGQFQFGANEQYVDSVHLYASCCDGLSLNITCQAGAFIIDFIQDFEGDSYKNAFAEELEQLGIAYRVSEEILFETPLDHLYHGEKKEKNREKRNAFSGLRGGEVCYNDSVMYE